MILRSRSTDFTPPFEELSKYQVEFSLQKENDLKYL